MSQLRVQDAPRSGSRIRAILLANLRASPAKSAVLGAGCVVLVVLLVRLASGGAKSAAANDVLAIVPEASRAVDTGARVDQAEHESRPREPRRPRPRLRQTLARDPFSLTWLGSFNEGSMSEDIAQAGDLALQLVLTADHSDRPGVAVISGIVVHPGSRVGRFQVAQIAARYVVLRDQQETVVLRMP